MNAVKRLMDDVTTVATKAYEGDGLNVESALELNSFILSGILAAVDCSLEFEMSFEEAAEEIVPETPFSAQEYVATCNIIGQVPDPNVEGFLRSAFPGSKDIEDL